MHVHIGRHTHGVCAEVRDIVQEPGLSFSYVDPMIWTQVASNGGRPLTYSAILQALKYFLIWLMGSELIVMVCMWTYLRKQRPWESYRERDASFPAQVLSFLQHYLFWNVKELLPLEGIVMHSTVTNAGCTQVAHNPSVTQMALVYQLSFMLTKVRSKVGIKDIRYNLEENLPIRMESPAIQYHKGLHSLNHVILCCCCF